MISFEAKDNAFYIREWDGYDRPYYFKLFELRDEENDFVGGRFSNNTIKRYKHRLKLKSTILIAINDHCLETCLSSPNLEEVITWLHENTSTWNIDAERFYNFYHNASKYHLVFTVHLNNDIDAMHFKLTWM